MPPRRAAAIGLLLLLATACTPEAAGPERPELIRPGWRELTLPVPPGPGDRIMLRDAVACGGSAYISGAIAAADGETRPMMWTSADPAGSWQPVRLQPHSYYGERSILYSLACRDGRVAILGAKVGGAHGNPRTSSWYQRDDGSFTEVLAEFELFGGPTAINVGRLAAGPGGWLIAGNRYSGAAVWTSADARQFILQENKTSLASDPAGDTWAADGSGTADGGWILAGGFLGDGRTDRDPMAWRSADGVTWSRMSTPATPAYDEFQRLAVAGDSVWAAGTFGGTFAVWRLDGQSWPQVGRFGAARGSGLQAVRSFVVRERCLLATIADGTEHQLWASADGTVWQQIAVPLTVTVAAGQTLSISAVDQRILLIADDGQGSRAWVGEYR
jgi:hypothetical protein